jgi:DNA-binding SARP family transcriptional activator
MAASKLSLIEAQNKSLVAQIEMLMARIEALETEVTQLKQQLAQSLSANGKEARAKSVDWVDQIWGTFANDPGFDEMVELGRKYRESLRPKPSRKKTKKKAASRKR